LKKNNVSLLNLLIEKVELPESAYEKAKKRYEDLGEWFKRDTSTLKDNNVHIYPQGSFMLGTAIRPILHEDDYDLDLVCKIGSGVSKKSHTQKSVKEMVGNELKKYIKKRGIKNPLESKRRCWTIHYLDDINFHMDILPAISADPDQVLELYQAMDTLGIEESVANQTSRLAIEITDNKEMNYNTITKDWNISNPEGYGVWFENRMSVTDKRMVLSKAEVDELPIYKRKSTLQRVIQLLKRHRDIMYAENDEQKPISIIITTLAARAYNGEDNISVALNNILQKMPNLINHHEPFVPNPAKPEEDFADKWNMEEYKDLELENNFHLWIEQAKVDFGLLTTSTEPNLIKRKIQSNFDVVISEQIIKTHLSNSSSNHQDQNPTEDNEVYIIENPPRPWGTPRK